MTMQYIMGEDGYEYGVGEDNERHRVFRIPQPNMGTFTDKLTKLAKRALKLGVAPPAYTLVREEPKTYHLDTGMEDEHGKPIMEERVVLINHILIYHPRVVVSNYEFMAKLEHTEEGNILHTIAGKTVPHQYRECEAWCDHCQVKRRRNDTFVLRHTTDDTYKQVGRNCLADYLGRNAESAAFAAELYYTADELGMASEGEDFSGGSGGDQYDILDRYLSYVAEVIAHVGWKSRTTANEFGGQATADVALFHLHPPPRTKREDLMFSHPTEASIQTAKLAIAWCEELSDQEVEDSDYLHNIRIIARRGVVGWKQYGFAASIVSAYLRHVGELKRKERYQQKPSHHVGTVGERRIFKLLVGKCLTMDGMYGTSTLHLMEDADGNRFTWSSTSGCLGEGKEVVIRGTIKKHGEYKGIPQTQLTRCEEVALHNYLVIVNGIQYPVYTDSEKDARRMVAAQLDLPKLPRGTHVIDLDVLTQPGVSP
jgi:hypothetical protein